MVAVEAHGHEGLLFKFDFENTCVLRSGCVSWSISSQYILSIYKQYLLLLRKSTRKTLIFTVMSTAASGGFMRNDAYEKKGTQ